MKKRVIVTLAFILTLISGYNVYTTNQEKMSDLIFENIEALAGELDTIYVTCGSSDGACWKFDGYCYSGEYTGKICRRTDITQWYCAKGC